MSKIAPDATIHPSAIVDNGASIGSGSRVWHFVHVCGEAVIGKKCSLGQNVFVSNHVTIGDNVKIQNTLFHSVIRYDMNNPFKQYGGWTFGATCFSVSRASCPRSSRIASLLSAPEPFSRGPTSPS